MKQLIQLSILSLLLLACTKTDKDVEQFNKLTNHPLPKSCFVLKQHIRIDKGFLVRKELLATGIRAERVHTSLLDLDKITINDSYDNTYAFVTITTKLHKQSVRVWQRTLDGQNYIRSFKTMRFRKAERKPNVVTISFIFKNRKLAQQGAQLLKDIIIKHRYN